ncbi:MAG TPA: chloride channel protein [Mizugakiibacter sp.]
MPSPDASPPRNPLQALLGHEFFAPHHWKRRLTLWSGAVVVALAAILFTKASNEAYALFRWMTARVAWLPLLLTPLVFAALAWLTEGRLRATRGSGIPQVIATLHVEDEGFRQCMLALPIALGKMLLTLIGLAAGASIGREGPTVHVGAGLFYTFGRWMGFRDPKAASRFILAGGAAGIAAAFNTPLAGVVFAIEELAGAFEHRFSGILLTAVIVAGIVSLGVMGNYAYFGSVTASLPLGQSWWAVLLCGAVCGLAGGVFARVILLGERGPLGAIARLRARVPILFAGACGLALVLVGYLAHGSIYGTGYDGARAIIQGAADAPDAGFGICKLLANVVSYWAGIPGGIFSPALAVGAGLGHNLAALAPHAAPAAVVLLGMSAYLSGVTQAPLTSAVIAMELTANQAMIIPVMAACLLARAASALVCPQPVYRAFARRLVDEFERGQQAAADAAHARAAETPSPESPR